MMSTDRIEKQVVIRATRDRVWRAISNSKEFGTWFGMRVEGPFLPGARLQVAIAPTQVNEEIAARQKPYEGHPFEIVIERMEPERLLSFRWHPFAIEPEVDYSAEPMTLVEFTLEEVAEGIRVTVTESGFDQIPLSRRARAFSANEGGWAIQVQLLSAYVAREE